MNTHIRRHFPGLILAAILIVMSGMSIDAWGQTSIYWGTKGAVQRLSLHDGLVETIRDTGDEFVLDVVVNPADQYLYWAESGANGGSIHRSALDGSNPQLLWVGEGQPEFMALAGGVSLYWTVGGAAFTGAIHALDLATLTHTLITEVDGERPQGIAIDEAEDKIYWSAYLSGPTGRIRRANLDGTDIETVFDGTDWWAMELDQSSRMLYWGGGPLWRCGLDDCQPELLVDGIKWILLGIDLDPASGKVYYLENGFWDRLDNVYRANLDGSGVELLYSIRGEDLGAGSTRGIAFYDGPGSTAASPSDMPSQMEMSVYPNPASTSVTVVFRLAEPGNVRLSIFDLLGREVDVFADGHFAPGRHEIQFMPDVSPGIYFAKIQTDRGFATKSLALDR